MDEKITAAIITGSLGFLATITTLYVTHRRSKEKRPRSIVSAIPGTWRGHITQDDRQSMLIIQLATPRGRIKGSATIISALRPDSPTITLELSGKFMPGRYLALDYNTTVPEIMQWGIVILELSADARELRGAFVGYGPYTETVVYGRVHLARQG